MGSFLYLKLRLYCILYMYGCGLMCYEVKIIVQSMYCTSDNPDSHLIRALYPGPEVPGLSGAHCNYMLQLHSL